MYVFSPNKDRSLNSVTFMGETLITGPIKFSKEGDRDMTYDDVKVVEGLMKPHKVSTIGGV